MTAEPNRKTMRDGSIPARDDRSMLILQLAVASFAVVASLLLSLVR